MELESAVRRAFAPATGPDRVGVEIELVPLADGGRPAPARLAPVLDARFAAVARPTFEPGGQLELSPAPQPLPAVIDTVLGLLRRVRERAARVGVELIAAGTDPHHDCTQVPLHRPTSPCNARSTGTDPTVAA